MNIGTFDIQIPIDTDRAVTVQFARMLYRHRKSLMESSGGAPAEQGEVMLGVLLDRYRKHKAPDSDEWVENAEVCEWFFESLSLGFQRAHGLIQTQGDQRALRMLQQVAQQVAPDKAKNLSDPPTLDELAVVLGVEEAQGGNPLQLS